MSLKDHIRKRLEEKEKGLIDKPIPEEDPMKIREDTDEGPNLLEEMREGPKAEEAKEPAKEEPSKDEGEEKETKKVEVEDFSDEAPPPKPELETKAAEPSETRSVPAKEGLPKLEGSAQSKHKVKTVYGEEELTLEELAGGYMRNAHYTQVQQIVREQEKFVKHLLQNPEDLVRFAMEQGIDLKALVSPDPIVPDIKIPELNEYANDEQKAYHEVMKTILDGYKKLANEVASTKAASVKRRMDEENDEVQRTFKSIRGDLPEIAEGAVYSILRKGRAMYGKAYSVQDAINDFKIAEGDLEERAFNSPKGKEKIDKIVREAIKKYSEGKTATREAHIAPDSLNITKGVVQEKQKKKFNTWDEIKDAARKAARGQS